MQVQLIEQKQEQYALKFWKAENEHSNKEKRSTEFKKKPTDKSV